MDTNITMSIPGDHRDAVEEVISFVESGQVLSKPYSPEDHNIEWPTKAITSLENVDSYRDPDWPNSKIKGDMAWMDITRIDEHKYARLPPTMSRKYLDETEERLSRYLQEQLTASVPEREIVEISCVLDYLIYLRTAQGKVDCFHESLFEIYQAGGYPIGWEGSYPNGKMVVFSMIGASLE